MPGNRAAPKKPPHKPKRSKPCHLHPSEFDTAKSMERATLRLNKARLDFESSSRAPKRSAAWTRIFGGDEPGTPHAKWPERERSTDCSEPDSIPTPTARKTA